MATTRIEQRCELGSVILIGNPGCERVAFPDGMGRPCVLRQKAGTDTLALQVGDCYAVLPRHLLRSLVCVGGRYLESGTFVDGGDEV
jgi:hypothetical protein